MLIVDAHLDLSWNALQWNRDLRQSVYTLRTQEGTMTAKGRALGTVALPELQEGRVALCFATLLARSTGQRSEDLDYGDPTQAYAVAQGQLAYYRALEAIGELRVITDLEGLDEHLAEWEQWESSGADGEPPPVGCAISMEGADPVLSPDHLETWYEDGLRLIGPTHYGYGRYCGGTGTEAGLTDLGQPLLEEMDRLGILLDLTHCSDESFWEALEVYNGPVLASHQNCRALVPHQRQFSDDQLNAVFARDGVVGAAFDCWMLKLGWTRQTPADAVGLSHVVDHIDYVCQLAGNSRHAAIGTDLDGGFGREQSPGDLDTIVDLQRIPALLGDRGYSDEDVANIMHGNWLRLLRQAWV